MYRGQRGDREIPVPDVPVDELELVLYPRERCLERAVMVDRPALELLSHAAIDGDSRVSSGSDRSTIPVICSPVVRSSGDAAIKRP